jgi:hypothetical protein
MLLLLLILWECVCVIDRSCFIKKMDQQHVFYEKAQEWYEYVEMIHPALEHYGIMDLETVLEDNVLYAVKKCTVK